MERERQCLGRVAEQGVSYVVIIIDIIIYLANESEFRFFPKGNDMYQ